MFDICLDDPLFSVSLAQVESVTCSFSSKQRPTIHLPSLQCFQSCWLLVVYFCCSTITITTFITTATTIVSQLPLIPLCKQVFISGAVELTTQLSKPVRILWLPKCRINKLGYLAREDYLDPLQLRVIRLQPCHVFYLTCSVSYSVMTCSPPRLLFLLYCFA